MVAEVPMLVDWLANDIVTRGRLPRDYAILAHLIHQGSFLRLASVA
jgi:hypothetical protein